MSLREAWKSTVKATWDTRSPDTAALLPGMVMGDRAALDEGLNESMKVLGLTHLTAVSGANCTLVIASLMLFLRTLRTPRAVAFAVSLAGLAGFVALVGPDPSVLRAAVMGGIGAMALLSGRPKRVGALLSGSIVVLLVVNVLGDDLAVGSEDLDADVVQIGAAVDGGARVGLGDHQNALFAGFAPTRFGEVLHSGVA